MKEDGRKNNGGARKGAGRPTKEDEAALVLKLSTLDDLAFETLEKGLKEGNYQYWNKFMEFRYGKPKERVDVTSGDEVINIPVLSFVK